MPSPAASMINAVCANALSLNRQATTLPTQDQRTKSAWMLAHVHGALNAASWL